METYRYNTLRFFRVQFGLPARMPLEWCVVRETSRAGSELRLGVALKGTGLYIDVAMRRFFSQIDIPLIERRCYPAERISRGKQTAYCMIKSHTILRDEACRSLFKAIYLGPPIGARCI